MNDGSQMTNSPVGARPSDADPAADTREVPTFRRVGRMPPAEIAGTGARALRLLAVRGARGAVGLGRLLLLQTEAWLVDSKRASYGLAVTRILLGLTVVGMSLTNFGTRFYTYGAGAAWTGQFDAPTNEFATIWPFNLVAGVATNDFAVTVLFLALLLCGVLLTIGYRTKLVLIPLLVLWVSITKLNGFVGDQSDNLIRMAFIAMFFTAPSLRWSLDARRAARTRHLPGGTLARMWRFQPALPAWATNASHNFAIIVLACQVSFIYVSGGLYKAGGAPWSGGYAIYNPLHVQQFGTWPELIDLVTAWGPGVAFATTLTLLVQISFPLLLLRRGTRIVALVVMLGFHLGIAVLMGLPWFSLAMIAIDSIFIRDVTWKALAGGLASVWVTAKKSAPARTSSPPAAAGPVPSPIYPGRDAAPPPPAPPPAVPGPLLPPPPAVPGPLLPPRAPEEFSSDPRFRPAVSPRHPDPSLPDEETRLVHHRKHPGGA